MILVFDPPMTIFLLTLNGDLMKTVTLALTSSVLWYWITTKLEKEQAAKSGARK